MCSFCGYFDPPPYSLIFKNFRHPPPLRICQPPRPAVKSMPNSQNESEKMLAKL